MSVVTSAFLKSGHWALFEIRNNKQAGPTERGKQQQFLREGEALMKALEKEVGKRLSISESKS